MRNHHTPSSLDYFVLLPVPPLWTWRHHLAQQSAAAAWSYLPRLFLQLSKILWGLYLQQEYDPQFHRYYYFWGLNS